MAAGLIAATVGAGIGPVATVGAAPGDSVCDLDGAGTPADPWTIDVAADLGEIVDCGLDGSYEQTGNFTLTGSHTPIGDGDDPFTGTYDGGGFTISGLVAVRPADNGVGLFGFAEGAVVTDLTLVAPQVTGTFAVGALLGEGAGVVIEGITVSGGSVTGTRSVGGVVGELTPREYGDPTEPDLEEFSLDDVTVSGVQVAGLTEVGGVVGYAFASSDRNVTVTEVAVAGTVTGHENVGGVAGQADRIYFEDLDVSVDLRVDHTSAGLTTPNVARSIGGVVGYLDRGEVYQARVTDITIEREPDPSWNPAQGPSRFADETGGVVGTLIGAVVDRVVVDGLTIGVDGRDLGGAVGLAEASTESDSERSQLLTIEVRDAAISTTDQNTARVGGLVGTLRASLVDAVTVDASIATSGSVIGGIVGQLEDGALRDSVAQVSTITGHRDVGGLVGSARSVVGNVSIRRTAAHVGLQSVVFGENHGGSIGSIVVVGTDDTPAVRIEDSYVIGEIVAGTGAVNFGGFAGQATILASAGTAAVEISNVYADVVLPDDASPAAGTLIGIAVSGPESGSRIDLVDSFGVSDDEGDPVIGFVATSPTFGNGTVESSTSSTITRDAAIDIDTYLAAEWPIQPGWESGGGGMRLRSAVATAAVTSAEPLWGICEQVNDGTPFLLLEYASDPCVDAPDPTPPGPTPPGPTPPVELPEPDRLAGADRYATAVAVSAAAFPSGASTVYMATGETFADALAAGPVAGLDDGPILLVRSDGIPVDVLAELRRLAPDTVVIVGGEAAIAASVETALEMEFDEVLRLAGVDRYATAAALSAHAFPDGADTVYVATGFEFADALSAVPPAGLSAGPLLLVRPDSVPDATADELVRLSPDRIVVLGGTLAISTTVAATLADFAATVDRIGGANRYETSAQLSAAFFPTGADTVYLASGVLAPDALSAGPSAIIDGSPVLLVRPTCVPEVVLAELERLDPDSVVIVGGPAAISAAVAAYTVC